MSTTEPDLGPVLQAIISDPVGAAEKVNEAIAAAADKKTNFIVRFFELLSRKVKHAAVVAWDFTKKWYWLPVESAFVAALAFAITVGLIVFSGILMTLGPVYFWGFWAAIMGQGSLMAISGTTKWVQGRRVERRVALL